MILGKHAPSTGMVLSGLSVVIITRREEGGSALSPTIPAFTMSTTTIYRDSDI
jgi:hypothetical protein